MDEDIFAAGASQQFGRAIGEHLVDVHVVRRAGACLVDVDNELIAKCAAENLVCCPGDSVADARVKAPERDVGVRRRLLDDNGGVDEEPGSAQSADREILERARRLNPVIGVSRNRPLTERVAFSASGHATASIILSGWPQAFSTAWCR